MRDVRVAKPYAQALFDAATEQQVVAEVVEDAHHLIELAEASPDFDEFVRNPIVSPQFKSETFQQILSDAIHPLSLNFLLLLASKQREKWLVSTLQIFLAIVDEKEGRLVAQVTTAIPLTESQQTNLINKLSAYSGKQVKLELNVDAAIRGGFIFQLGDTVFDGSIASQLQRMKTLLARG